MWWKVFNLMPFPWNFRRQGDRASLTERLTVKGKVNAYSHGSEWMKEYNYALQNADTRLRLQSTTKTMVSHREKKRNSDFVALETLLLFENCSSSHCLLSSWRRFHVFESSHPSFHHIVFFVASLWAYVVVASFLCLRVVGSSFRRLPYILGQVLDVWGHILYCYFVTLLPFYSVTLLLCPLVILSLCHPVTLFPYSLVTLLSIFLILVYLCMTNHNFLSLIDAFFFGGGE